MSNVDIIPLNTIHIDTRVLKRMEFKECVVCSCNNLVTRLCMDLDCDASSGICSEEGCDCEKLHKHCLVQTPFQAMMQKLIEKGVNESKRGNSIVQIYQRAIKQLSIDRDEYKSAISDTGLILHGNQKVLYNLLHSGGIKNTTSKLINDVFISLKQMPAKDSKQDIERVSKLLQKAVTEIRQLWKFQRNTASYSWNAELCALDTFKISNNNKTIQRIINPMNMTRVAMGYPSLSSFQNRAKKIQFKINKLNGDLYIGACHRSTVTNKMFQFYPQLNGGCYLVNSNDGQVYSQIENQPHGSGFSMVQGDIVEIQYKPHHSYFVLSNLTKGPNTSTIVKFKVQDKDPLHLCIGMYYPGTQVEIIKTKIKQNK